ncbi:hypothetical protein [Janthinobacterium sp. 78]|uniref:hypothetical protein n=1 Tax=Janthinobacterium sp. 78 TaxID=2135631 RepID=UPI000D5C3CE7|nr:hypothetical protein [Janthinobacterium sp. 78]PVX34730.1 hypothetical protein C8C92_1291 [Janthinobacterium sp. 78]
MRPSMTRTHQVNQGKRTASGAMRTRLSRDNSNAVKKASNSITWGITIISAISLTLTLLGYGVAMAVETTFGIPHQTVYTSVLDLLGLSVYAMISVVLGIDAIKWQPMLEQAWPIGLVATAGMFIFICGPLYSATRQAKTLMGPNSFWRYFWRPTKHDSSGRLLAKEVIKSGLLGGFIFISPLLVAGGLLFTVILISIVPIFGIQLGTLYFRKFVISPATCEPVRAHAALLQVLSTPRKKNVPVISTANCVALFKDATRVAIGRVVVSTPAAIVLFEPVSGSTQRVPIGELTVQVVDHVPAINRPQP